MNQPLNSGNNSFTTSNSVHSGGVCPTSNPAHDEGVCPTSSPAYDGGVCIASTQAHAGDMCTIYDPLYPGCTLTYEVAAPIAERGEAYLSNPGAHTPSEPRPAATVILLSEARSHLRAWERDDQGVLINPVREPARGPVDVFMFRRASTMAFVPDAVVFPGGGVDATDYDFSGAWCGPTPQDWAHLLNCTPCHARGIIVAAVRELFEESGILLASDEHGAMAHDVCGDHWAKERALIAHRSLRLDDFLTCEHLVLRTDLLHLRSHWVTPPSEKRRYDTYFFAVRKPADQHADARTSEAVESSWITPREALMRAKKGYLKLMPPTVSNLCSLERAATVDEAYELPFDGHVEPFPFLNEEGKVVMRAEVH